MSEWSYIWLGFAIVFAVLAGWDLNNCINNSATVFTVVLDIIMCVWNVHNLYVEGKKERK